MTNQTDMNIIEKLLTYCRSLVIDRLNQYFGLDSVAHQAAIDLSVLMGDGWPENLGTLSTVERQLLAIVLSPYVYPAFYDRIIQEFLPNGGDIIELGGVKNTGNHRGFLPTGETAIFLIAGDDLQKRMEVHRLLMGESRLLKEGILTVEHVKDSDPPMSGRLTLGQEWLSRVLLGKEQLPSFGPDFPAKPIRTQLNWEDLVIAEKTREQLEDIRTWLRHNAGMMVYWQMERLIKPGYRVLFYGPPGTGKTLTATLLGKEFKRDVFRIDLSQVVSKYIGETEKNLEKVFRKAEHRDWILFFDEADALFGKRSNVQSSHDRYANQEVAYLLQRVEDFPGLVILASNFRNNIDRAFMRRFNAVVHFPMPGVAERQQLWQSMLPDNEALAPDVNVSEIAAKYELSGSAILQAVHYASLKAYAAGDRIIDRQVLLAGIQREFEKEERVFK